MRFPNPWLSLFFFRVFLSYKATIPITKILFMIRKYIQGPIEKYILVIMVLLSDNTQKMHHLFFFLKNNLFFNLYKTWLCILKEHTISKIERELKLEQKVGIHLINTDTASTLFYICHFPFFTSESASLIKVQNLISPN